MRKMSKFLAVAAIAAASLVSANAQTEAFEIIDTVSTAFDLLVPITVSIVTFFVVIRLAKRVVK